MEFLLLLFDNKVLFEKCVLKLVMYVTYAYTCKLCDQQIILSCPAINWFQENLLPALISVENFAGFFNRIEISLLKLYLILYFAFAHFSYMYVILYTGVLNIHVHVDVVSVIILVF